MCRKSHSTLKEKQEALYANAEFELSYEKEKIVLLSSIKKTNYDTLYLVLRDYYVLTSDNTYSEDSIVFIYNKAINSISKNYNIPKSKVASLIFSFKYEMQTKEDVIDNFKEEETENEQQQPNDPRY